MMLSFKTRQAAREFHSKRVAKGLTGKLVDNGKEHSGKLSRYAVTLR